MEDVRAALTALTGRLPRRVVLLGDGALADKVHNPTSTELVPVSVVCEILRRERREPVYSRHTAHLLAQCLATNSSGAWQALLDDMYTGDADELAMRAFWSDDDILDGLVRCLAEANTGEHAWMVISVMRGVIERVDRERTTRALGRAFQLRFHQIVACISTSMRTMSPEYRTTAITTLGQLMLWCRLPTTSLCAMLDTALQTNTDDVLHLFLFAPMADLARHDPALVERILRHAERASQAQRYPSCSLLALLVTEQLAPYAPRVLLLVQKTLSVAAAQGSLDAHLAMACGRLAKVASQPRSLSSCLGHALSCMATQAAAP